MREVFRSQSVEARRALVACWAFLSFVGVASWGAAVGSVGEHGWAQPLAALAGTMALVLFTRLQLAACRGGAELGQWWIAPTVVALCVIPLLWGPLAPTSLIVGAAVWLQRDPRVAAVEMIVTLALLAGAMRRSDSYESASFFALISELGIYTAVLVAVTRLAVLLDSLHFTRALLAQRRVDHERERVGRDLHDLMGRTLVAASLRNQAAVRAAGGTSPEGDARLEAIHDALVNGQSQLRALTSGPTIARLDDELVTARELCERVSIEFELDIRACVPRAHDGVAALVVRESVTNVLKHRRATRFRIFIYRTEQTIDLVIVNDGPGDDDVLADGLESRAARAVANAQGTVRIDHPTLNEHRLIVRLPLKMTSPS